MRFVISTVDGVTHVSDEVKIDLEPDESSEIAIRDTMRAIFAAKSYVSFYVDGVETYYNLSNIVSITTIGE